MVPASHQDKTEALDVVGRADVRKKGKKAKRSSIHFVDPKVV